VKIANVEGMLCIKLPLFPLITWDLTYLRQCNTLGRNPIFYSFSRFIAIVAVAEQQRLLANWPTQMHTSMLEKSIS